MILFKETYLVKTSTQKKKIMFFLQTKGENLKKDGKQKENSQNTLLSRRLLRKRQSS